MRKVLHGGYRVRCRRGATLLEVMVVLGFVAMLSSATAVYNKEIQRQVILTREHAVALGLFVRARSAALTYPKSAPNELICGYGVHVDAASRTFTYFKDLGNFTTQSCAPADADGEYDPGEEIERKVLSDTVTVTSEDMTDIVFVPPFGKVYMDGNEARGTASVVIQRRDVNIKKGISANAFGQITEFTPPTP